MPGTARPRVLANTMNRYPVWKYAIIVIALLVGAIYTLPNFFGEAPAVQVSSGKAIVKVDSTTRARVEEALAAAGIKPEVISLDANSVKVRVADTDTQLKAKDAIQKALIPDPADPSYVVALNLLSRSPTWLLGPARGPDVPGPGPARRRALHAAGGHAGGAVQEGRVAGRRPAHHAAREEHSPRRHQPQRPDHRGAPARLRRPWKRPRP